MSIEDRVNRLDQHGRQIYEAMRDLGMSPGAALLATEGREGPRDGDLYEAFGRMGLGEAAARIAADGRGGPQRVQRSADVPVRHSRSLGERDRLDEAARAYGASTNEDLARFDAAVGGVEDSGLAFADALAAVERQLREASSRHTDALLDALERVRASRDNDRTVPLSESAPSGRVSRLRESARPCHGTGWQLNSCPHGPAGA